MSCLRFWRLLEGGFRGVGVPMELEKEGLSKLNKLPKRRGLGFRAYLNTQ